MPESLLHHLPTLNALAAAWLERGARQVSLMDHHGQPVRAWYGEPCPDVVRFAHAVNEGSFWCVEIAASPEARARFDAESYLLSRLARAEYELNALTEELVSAQDRLVALFKLNQMPHAGGSLPDLVGKLVRATRDIMGAEGVAICLAEGPSVTDTALPLGDDHLRQLITTHSGPDTILENSVMGSPVRSILTAPIAANEGWLCVLSGRAGAFDASDRKLAEAIANQTGTFLENHRLHAAQIQTARIQTEMRLARDVQLALVPNAAPQQAGLDVFAATRPASMVGGDFFNFAQPSDRCLNFVLADLTGKGMSAAMLMTMTRVTLQAGWAAYEQASPAELVAFSNRVLYADFTRVGVFATLFCGSYDAASRTLAFTNAGQSPVVMCPAQGPARLLEAEGVPLGIIEGYAYGTRSLKLRPGDVVLVGTDGLTEAWRGEEMFGYERLLRLIEAHRHLPAEGLARAVLEAVSAFSQGKQHDDQTLIVLKIQGE